MTQNPPIRTLIDILGECKMFDDAIERDSFWISGTYLGQAFTVQFNYDGIGRIAQDKILEIVGAIK